MLTKFEPTNEQGVIGVYFEIKDAFEQATGLRLRTIQTRYPDALFIDREGREKRVEFEYKARNFLLHQHDPKGCDLIVCWEDDYPGAPVPVFSLRTFVHSMVLDSDRKPAVPLPYYWMQLQEDAYRFDTPWRYRLTWDTSSNWLTWVGGQVTALALLPVVALAYGVAWVVNWIAIAEIEGIAPVQNPPPYKTISV